VLTSPERKRSAIQLLEDDGDLSDNEHIRAMKLICRDTSVADVLLAVGSSVLKSSLVRFFISKEATGNRNRSRPIQILRDRNRTA
jgi:hypothetical protein